MGQFPIIRAKGTLPGVSGQVRGNVDFDTGEGQVGQAIAGLGGVAMNLGITLKNIELQRIKDRDTRNTIKAESYLDVASAEHELFREQNADTSLWLDNYKELNKKALEMANQLDLSEPAREMFNERANAHIFINEKKALISIAKQEREDTFDAVTTNMIKAVESGSAIRYTAAKNEFLEAFAGRVDKQEALARLVATIKEGTENRQKNVLNSWQNEVAENPDQAEFALKEELSARGDGKGNIPEEDLSSESIQALLNTATNRKIQIISQMNEAFANRQGEETQRLSDMLIKGELTEQEIEAVDLQSIGKQKTDEFKWKQEWKDILRKTVSLSEPIVSDERVYDSLVVGSELVERGTKSPAEWDKEYAQAWADGKLEKEDRRSLRSKDIVSTKMMQNRAFTDATTNTMPRLVEMRDDELAGLISARDNALKLKDLTTVSALNFSIKKAQIQKWNFGRFRKELREQMAQNDWSQKQIFVAADILAKNYDKPIADVMLEFERANPQESIIGTPPDDEFDDIWKDLSPEDKAKIWELRLLGVSTKEIIGELP